MMSLLKSAQEFLVESLENYEKGKLTFSILHAITATELLLKERLARINPNLIFKRIDSRRIHQERTVGLKDLPQRLLNLDVHLSSDELETIRTVSEWRHQIVHHVPRYSPEEAARKLGALYDFLAGFASRELRLELKAIIPKSLFKTVDGLLRDWERVISEAQAKARAEGNLVRRRCPVCDVAGTICLRGERGFCHLCATELHAGRCPICRELAVDTHTGLSGEVYHWNCLDDYARAQLELVSSDR